MPPLDGPTGGEDAEAQGGTEARGVRNAGQCSSFLAGLTAFLCRYHPLGK